MREAFSNRDCLSVCLSVRPYVTLFYKFVKCTLVTSSCISSRITKPCGLVYFSPAQYISNVTPLSSSVLPVLPVKCIALKKNKQDRKA